jgi:hypothetical protein
MRSDRKATRHAYYHDLIPVRIDSINDCGATSRSTARLRCFFRRRLSRTSARVSVRGLEYGSTSNSQFIRTGLEFCCFIRSSIGAVLPVTLLISGESDGLFQASFLSLRLSGFGERQCIIRGFILSGYVHAKPLRRKEEQLVGRKKNCKDSLAHPTNECRQLISLVNEEQRHDTDNPRSI